jgi:stage III sporulation protein SpoIIIAA
MGCSSAVGERAACSHPLQHEVMIMRLENHNPEVIVTTRSASQAVAARHHAERGVQLTALRMAIPGELINSYSLRPGRRIEFGHPLRWEACRRGPKTVLERRFTTSMLIEIRA